MTNYTDSKSGPKYEVGMPVKIYDADDEKIVNGTVTEVGEETIVIQWEDLTDDTEYQVSSITLRGDFIIEH